MEFDRARLTLIAISTLPIIIGFALSSSVLQSSNLGTVILDSRALSPLDLLVQALVSTTLGLVVVSSLFWMMRRKNRGVQRIAVAFMVSPMLILISLFLGNLFFIMLFKGTSDALQGLIMMFSLGVSMLAIVLIVIDAIPAMIRNFFVAFYGGVFGTFLGIITVTASITVLIISLIVEDYFLTKFHPVQEESRLLDKIGSDPFDYTRIQTETVAVGVGDFVAFSLIAAHTIIYFPPFVWVMSGAMLLLGIVINVSILAKEGELLPAIPLPALLAILPWFIHLITFFSMGG